MRGRSPSHGLEYALAESAAPRVPEDAGGAKERGAQASQRSTKGLGGVRLRAGLEETGWRYDDGEPRTAALCRNCYRRVHELEKDADVALLRSRIQQVDAK